MKIINYTFEAVVVGSGAAGLKAADRLFDNGVKNVAIVTEGINTGTSRNTGSDKQTYYKLSLSGGAGDSPLSMAEDFFKGGCVDGDNALAEAANSAQCFLSLVRLGVPFPTNRFGEFVGYKTDHDTRSRATSVGPLTSKLMTEALEKSIVNKGVRIIDNTLVVSIIKNEDEAVGLIGFDGEGFTLINCPNIIFATGGPAVIYENSVFPECHTGSSGVLFSAGVSGQNVTEWQFGLASVSPRWNVSGTYMQVLPRFVSIDSEGKKHFFLEEHFGKSDCLSLTFLKGYEWPFDSRKALDGSSVIDLLVYRESEILERKVYMDFRENPYGGENVNYENLSKDAFEYLKSASSCFGNPIDRLLHMNSPAYELYLSKGVDLKKEPLQIALCAQHHNGGVKVDMWWQSDILGLFVAGEAAGTHGIYRPGGSALNSGQVGGMRSADYISAHKRANLSASEFEKVAKPMIECEITLCKSVARSTDNIARLDAELKNRMSKCAGAVRNPTEIKKELDFSLSLLKNFERHASVSGNDGLRYMYKLRDNVFARSAVLFAYHDYITKGGKTRGSALYTDNGGQSAGGLEERFRFTHDKGEKNDSVQEIKFQNGQFSSLWRKVREIPEENGFFENVWREYRKNGNIY